MFLDRDNFAKAQEIVNHLQDEKEWLERESKHQLEESQRKLENVRAGELQELRRGKVEALQVLQVCGLFSMYYFQHCKFCCHLSVELLQLWWCSTFFYLLLVYGMQG